MLLSVGNAITYRVGVVSARAAFWRSVPLERTLKCVLSSPVANGLFCEIISVCTEHLVSVTQFCQFLRAAFPIFSRTNVHDHQCHHIHVCTRSFLLKHKCLPFGLQWLDLTCSSCFVLSGVFRFKSALSGSRGCWCRKVVARPGLARNPVAWSARAVRLKFREDGRHVKLEHQVVRIATGNHNLVGTEQRACALRRARGPNMLRAKSRVQWRARFASWQRAP